LQSLRNYIFAIIVVPSYLFSGTVYFSRVLPDSKLCAASNYRGQRLPDFVSGLDPYTLVLRNYLPKFLRD